MKINSTTTLLGESVMLIPYRSNHVEKYHKWMSSPELQELTASEPLTIEEEYKMQESWFADNDKCTFIILDKEKFQISSSEIEAMIGDTNLFFNDEDKTIAEAEIMIAEKEYRRKGRGKEAMLMMFKYAVDHLHVKKFTVKIGYKNKPSISMFEKMMFTIKSQSDVFEEFTLDVLVTSQWLEWLNNSLKLYEYKKYLTK